ncbi:hypothetical protein GCM10023335_54630 [Streptomyces siamensis]|uniref:Uncharacterized protein n=1 Tax=Streptomyces siamensis TaxID=1274986 RepID=A0ABP9J8A4_9ACTN
MRASAPCASPSSTNDCTGGNPPGRSSGLFAGHSAAPGHPATPRAQAMSTLTPTPGCRVPGRLSYGPSTGGSRNPRLRPRARQRGTGARDPSSFHEPVTARAGADETPRKGRAERVTRDRHTPTQRPAPSVRCPDGLRRAVPTVPDGRRRLLRRMAGPLLGVVMGADSGDVGVRAYGRGLRAALSATGIPPAGPQQYEPPRVRELPAITTGRPGVGRPPTLTRTGPDARVFSNIEERRTGYE